MNARASDLSHIRVPPHSQDSEAAVLGALMLDPDSLAKVADWLIEDDFYRADHRLIYRAVLELAEECKPYDPVTLGEWFEANGVAHQVGNGAYLIELSTTTPSAANIVAYAEIVREKAQQRRLIELGTDIVNGGFSGKSSEDIVSTSLHTLGTLQNNPRAGGLVPAHGDLRGMLAEMHDRYQNGNRITGLPLPWAAANRATGGLQDGEVTILAGRPGMGKSIFVDNVLLPLSMRGINCAKFEIEMTARQGNRRRLAALAEIPYAWLRNPDAEHEEYWGRLAGAMAELQRATLLVDESPGLTIDKIVARAKRAHMQKSLRLIAIDHMHDMSLPGKKEVRQEYGDIVQGGKWMAKKFGCHVIIAAQLNRSLETRADKRPVMSDLRESGEIEQKADLILFPYREDYYHRNEPGYQKTRLIEIGIGKGRDIEVGAPIMLREEFEYMRMSDWEGPLPERGVPAKMTSKGMAF